MKNPYEKIEEEKWIKHYSPLVKKISRQVASKLPSFVSLDDIYQEGMEGLLKALRNKSNFTEDNFSSYLQLRIRGAIYDAFRKGDSVPRHIRDKIDSVKVALPLLEQKLGRHPSDGEISSHLGISVKDYHEILESSVDLTALDKLPEELLPPSEENFVEILDKSKLLSNAETAIKKLPERMRIVLALIYQEELTYKEISEIMDITPGRISQIHTQAILQIREDLKLSN